MGKKNKKTHIICRRCGKHAYHATHAVCSACGFGKTSKIKSNAWQWKSPVGKGNRKK